MDYRPSVCRKCKKNKTCKATLNNGKMPCKEWVDWFHSHWSAIRKDINRQ